MHILLIVVITGSLSLCVGIFLYCLRVIRVRQALVICDRITGKVHRIIVGPRVVIIWPLEQTFSLDLVPRVVHLSANDVTTSDLVITTSLDVFFGFDSILLQENPEAIPLTAAETLVQSWANYILRTLVAGYTTTDLLAAPVHRARLENLLRQTLQDRVAQLGLRIHAVRLLCYPAPLMLDAQLAAARTQLAAQARARALELLAAALGSTGDVTRILPLELLQRLQGQGEAVTALNLSIPVNSTANHQDPLAMHWVLASR